MWQSYLSEIKEFNLPAEPPTVDASWGDWTTEPHQGEAPVHRQEEIEDVAQAGIQLEEHWFHKAELLLLENG